MTFIIDVKQGQIFKALRNILLNEVKLRFFVILYIMCLTFISVFLLLFHPLCIKFFVLFFRARVNT